MKANLTRELANLFSFTGRLLTVIRAHSWTMRAAEGKSDADIFAVREYADATHNLQAFGRVVAAYADEDDYDPSLVIKSCDRLIVELEAALKLDLGGNTFNRTLDLGEGVGYLKAIQEKVRQTHAL